MPGTSVIGSCNPRKVDYEDIQEGFSCWGGGRCSHSGRGRLSVYENGLGNDIRGGRYAKIAPDAYLIGKDNSIRICLDKVPELALVGGAVKIVDANLNDSLIVVRESEDGYVAASIKCTHRGVEVEYRADDKCLKCASLGGSRFKTNGEKISGFAKGPLKTYPSFCEDNILVIRLA